MEHNDWAVVTGASSGIGKGFVYELAKKGITQYWWHGAGTNWNPLLSITSRIMKKMIGIA